jgi:tRNA dimethylallyltransferase
MLDAMADGTFEVIAADAIQAYRGLDIGAAKPGPRTLSRLPHHLLDILDPREQYTCGDFVRRAEGEIRAVRARGRAPVVCGGSAYYLKSLIYGMPAAPKADPEVRASLEAEVHRRGLPALYDELRRTDPDAGTQIQPRDRYRILRALEIQRVSGMPRSSFDPPNHPRSDLRFRLLGVRADRDELAIRVAGRVGAMFEQGLVEEVRGLIQRGYRASDPGMRGIGYREFFEIRAGCAILGEVRERITANTLRYAKRQATFFRSIPDITWIGRDGDSQLAAAIHEAVPGA